MTLVALTLTEPWASLVAIGAKQIETRSWPLAYRGPVLITAAKKCSLLELQLMHQEPFRSALCAGGITDAVDLTIGLGKALAVVDLVGCFQFTTARMDVIASEIRNGELPPDELAFGDFASPRFGFRLRHARRLRDPIPVRGMLGLWTVPPDVSAAVSAQLSEIET